MHLDIEMAMSMAPGVTEIRVFQGANLFQDMATTTPLTLQFSRSWYFGPIDPIMRDAFREFQLQGQSFSLASGDFGPIKEPMSAANIDGLTLVGGTELVMNGNGNSYSSETAWTSSTGWVADGAGNAALSTPIPSYQTGIDMAAVGGSKLYRNSPDVSLPADQVYVVFPGGTGPIGGTSCASPMWAGFMALVNQQNQTKGLAPVGFANPVLYAMSGVPATYANSFTDILSGPDHRSCRNYVQGVSGVRPHDRVGIAQMRVGQATLVVVAGTEPRGGSGNRARLRHSFERKRFLLGQRRLRSDRQPGGHQFPAHTDSSGGPAQPLAGDRTGGRR